MSIDNITIKFYGVRGSFPTAGQVLGGHTSCLSITYRGTRFVVDAGSGAIDLGDEIMRDILAGRGEQHVTMLFSHAHGDHIEGLRALKPIYHPELVLDMLGGTHDGRGIEEILSQHVFAPPVFPVPYRFLKSRRSIRQFGARDTLTLDCNGGNVRVEVREMHHPNQAYGFRFMFPCGRVVAVTQDHGPHAAMDNDIVELWRGATLVVTEAQYTDVKQLERFSYGHENATHVGELVREARPAEVVTTHHDPEADSLEVFGICERIHDVSRVPTTPAFDGRVIVV